MNTEVQEPVSAAFAMRLHLPQPYPCIPITAFLHYAVQDPYAVRVTFRMIAGDDPVVWHMGRDLIRDGLIRLTGEGDIQVAPDPGQSDGVFFRLTVDEASATLTAPRRPIQEFLQRTAEVVPFGQETRAPGFLAEREAALARLLADS